MCVGICFIHLVLIVKAYSGAPIIRGFVSVGFFISRGIDGVQVYRCDHVGLVSLNLEQ